MEITREMILERREGYRRRREELMANVNALSGAMDDCEIWLGVLEQRMETEGIASSQSLLAMTEEGGAGSAIPGKNARTSPGTEGTGTEEAGSAIPGKNARTSPGTEEAGSAIPATVIPARKNRDQRSRLQKKGTGTEEGG